MLSQTLNQEDQRAVAEGLTEAELAILDHPYPPEVYDAKVQAVFDHIATAYGDDGASIYDTAQPGGSAAAAATTLTVQGLTTAQLTDDIVERLHDDAEFVSLVAEQLGLTGKPELRSIDELIENDEDYAVEFKSTARWDLRENQPNNAMEDAVVKTIAGFLNTDRGTLLIGIGPNRQPVGLSHDYPRVKPQNGDGFVNWLTTHLINALGHPWAGPPAPPRPARHPHRHRTTDRVQRGSGRDHRRHPAARTTTTAGCRRTIHGHSRHPGAIRPEQRTAALQPAP